MLLWRIDVAAKFEAESVVGVGRRPLADRLDDPGRGIGSISVESDQVA